MPNACATPGASCDVDLGEDEGAEHAPPRDAPAAGRGRDRTTHGAQKSTTTGVVCDGEDGGLEVSVADVDDPGARHEHLTHGRSASHCARERGPAAVGPYLGWSPVTRAPRRSAQRRVCETRYTPADRLTVIMCSPRSAWAGGAASCGAPATPAIRLLAQDGLRELGRAAAVSSRPQGAGRDGDGEDLVVVRHPDDQVVALRVEGPLGSELDAQAEDVAAAALAGAYRPRRRAIPSGPVPERRRPGALLDDRLAVASSPGRGSNRRTRACDGGLRGAVRRERVDAGRLADPRAPAAGRVLEHARVVEGALAAVEVGIAPHACRARRARARRRAGRRVDARAVAASPATSKTCSCVCPVGVDPALDDLDALEVGARRAPPCPGSFMRPDGEARAARRRARRRSRRPSACRSRRRRATKSASPQRDAARGRRRRSARPAACRWSRRSRAGGAPRRSRRASSPRPTTTARPPGLSRHVVAICRAGDESSLP